MRTTSLNEAARLRPPPAATLRGFALGDACMLRPAVFGRVARTAPGDLLAPGGATRVLVVPEGVSLSRAKLGEALADPASSPYPVYGLDPPRASPTVDALSRVALVAACLHGAWGGFVGIAFPAAASVADVFYGGDALSEQRRFRAVVDLVAKKGIVIGKGTSRQAEDRAFFDELKEMAR